MFFSKKKEGNVFDLFEEHIDLLNKVLQSLNDTLKLYSKSDEKYLDTSYDTHKLEHTADKIETQITNCLFSGAFFTSLRSDFAELVNLLGDIAGESVTISRLISQQKPDIPKKFWNGIFEICDETLKLPEYLKSAIHFLEEDVDKIEPHCKDVWAIESKIDSISHRLITLLFEDKDIDLAHKLQLKDLFVELAKISDIAEDVADKISILSMNLNI